MKRPAVLTCLLALLAAAARAQTNAPPPALAELPHWPIGLRLPDALITRKPEKGPPRADILAWAPAGDARIRAVMLIPENTDSKHVGEHAPLRAVAEKHRMAIVYLRRYDTGIEMEAGTPDRARMPALLAWIADQTGIAEFRHAPWVTFGKSSRGKFPFRAAWLFPERTLASIGYHGETPTWPLPPWATPATNTVLALNINGETEWGGTWFNHVRPALLNYRARTAWLPHQVVVKAVGHGDYPDAHGSPGWGTPFPDRVTCLRVWDYLALFVDKALTLRLPPAGIPTDAPLALQQVDESAGFILDPFAVEERFHVPHLPLKEGPDGFVSAGSDEPAVTGYAAIAPPPGMPVPDGVPVDPLVPGESPRRWILTDSLKFAMAADPMLELGALRTLTPKPGDTVTIDGAPLTFGPMRPEHEGMHGGIRLSTGLKPPRKNITLLAYTVLDVPAARHVRVGAGYTAATRIQLVLAGVPVKHRQVLALQPGRYPLLVVLRMSADWGCIEPRLENVSEADIALAKSVQAEADRAAAELASQRASGLPAAPLIRPVADVPPAEQRRGFWLADRELADAWIRLHAMGRLDTGD